MFTFSGLFVCFSAQGALYCIEDQTEGIQLTHRLQLLDKDCPDMMGACGPVEDLNWTPDGAAVAMIWKKGGFAIWSVFGALISFCLSVVHEGIPRSVSALVCVQIWEYCICVLHARLIDWMISRSVYLSLVRLIDCLIGPLIGANFSCCVQRLYFEYWISFLQKSSAWNGNLRKNG